MAKRTFNNKFRVDTTRLKTWNYGWAGAYFITICTQNREQFFGQIVDGKMQFSEIGNIVETEWLKTFDMRPDMNLQLDEFVVMPNHFHAIIKIGRNIYNSKYIRELECNGECLTKCNGECRDAMHCVSTTANINTNSIQNAHNTKNHFGPQSKNLASIVRGFKIGVIRNARKINPDFAWQSR